jgi:hypothetical protein
VRQQPTQLLTNVKPAESIARASLQEGREAMQAMTAALIKIIRNRQEGKDSENIADSNARKDGMVAILRQKYTEFYEEFKSFYEKLPQNVLLTLKF